MIAGSQPKTPQRAKKQQQSSFTNPPDNDFSRQILGNQYSEQWHNGRDAPQPQRQNGQSPDRAVLGDLNLSANHSPQSSELEEPSIYEDMDVVSGNKRPPRKQARKQQNGPPRQLQSVSPPQISPYPAQAMDVPAPANSMTPVKPAYAGPTFHASPAASALPLPKFFSKSTPATPVPSSMQARLDQEFNGSDKPTSPISLPIVPLPSSASRQDESPLDIFFRADKAEKAESKGTRLLTTSTIKSTTTTTKPALPHLKSEPQQKNTSWAEAHNRPVIHERSSSNGTGKDMFIMEMDGSSPPANNTRSPHVALRRTSAKRSTTAPSTVPLLGPLNGNHNHSNGQSMNSTYDQDYFLPTPVSHKTTPSSDLLPTHFVDSSRFCRPTPPHTPGDADISPIRKSREIDNQHSLHYGNRNLSPVFKAVKHDSVRRTSGLRKELHASPPVSGPVELSGNTSDDSPSHRSSTLADQAAMSYLQSCIPRPPVMPKLNLRSMSNQSVPASFAPSDLPAQSRNRSSVAANSDSSPGSNAKQNHHRTPLSPVSPIDVKSMEQDLRRILNMNVFGKTPDASSVH